MIFMQNKAKIIILLVVLLIVVVAITGNSSIFVQWEPVAIQKTIIL